MRSISIAIFTLSSLFFYTCGNSNKEIPLDDKGREDFISFHHKFYHDSTFQMFRIEFPLFGKNPDGSKERFLWDVDNWTVQKAVANDNEDVKFVPFYDMGDVMRERIIVQNRFMIENLFSLINNKWYLTSYSGIHDIGYYSKKKKPILGPEASAETNSTSTNNN
jgi:hypothetical protein